MARNRYGWQKRAKELARKQKHDDKMKRRQGKAPESGTEVRPQPDAPSMDSMAEPDSIEPRLPTGPSQPD